MPFNHFRVISLPSIKEEGAAPTLKILLHRPSSPLLSSLNIKCWRAAQHPVAGVIFTAVELAVITFFYHLETTESTE